MLYSSRDIQLKNTTIFLTRSYFYICPLSSIATLLINCQVSCFSVQITINMCFFSLKFFPHALFEDLTVVGGLVGPASSFYVLGLGLASFYVWRPYWLPRGRVMVTYGSCVGATLASRIKFQTDVPRGRATLAFSCNVLAHANVSLVGPC